MASTLRQIVKSSPLLLRVAVPAFRTVSTLMAHQPSKGKIPEFGGNARLEAASFGTLLEFQEWLKDNAELTAKWEREDVAAIAPGETAFTVAGYCGLCSAVVGFRVTTEYAAVNTSGQAEPNWREQLICPDCRLRNRVRAALHLAIQDFSLERDQKIYITEQFGPAYRWLRGRFGHVQGSEYLSATRASGSQRFGITHQDVQALSFPPASADWIFSFDVLEHVPDPLAAFASFARVLQPSGRLMMTVPFTIDRYDTTVRSIAHGDGRIEHLLPIEVHGNPTDPFNGSLCFRHFGWDTLAQLRSAGFTDARVYVYHDRELGYLGRAQSLISAVRA